VCTFLLAIRKNKNNTPHEIPIMGIILNSGIFYGLEQCKDKGNS
jgi:hypothetical protein